MSDKFRPKVFVVSLLGTNGILVKRREPSRIRITKFSPASVSVASGRIVKPAIGFRGFAGKAVSPELQLEAPGDRKPRSFSRSLFAPELGRSALKNRKSS